ncbi:hypothetical protein BE20_14725 [Sorangium cellulosum]|nr:hypothetical protein BE20_14725 [Sorangium cellulosum]
MIAARRHASVSSAAKTASSAPPSPASSASRCRASASGVGWSNASVAGSLTPVRAWSRRTSSTATSESRRDEAVRALGVREKPQRVAERPVFACGPCAGGFGRGLQRVARVGQIEEERARPRGGERGGEASMSATVMVVSS